MSIEYPISGNHIGKDPIVFKGNSFVWDEELNQWVFVAEVEK